MSNNKESSVEWLVNFFESGVTSREEWLQAKEQAVAMHKEEIEDAYKNGWDAGDFGSDCWEEIYYNETFGGNK